MRRINYPLHFVERRIANRQPGAYVELTSELNIEKYKLLKTGHLRFSHPEGSHDDVFWSLALAVYAKCSSTASWKRRRHGLLK